MPARQPGRRRLQPGAHARRLWRLYPGRRARREGGLAMRARAARCAHSPAPPPLPHLPPHTPPQPACSLPPDHAEEGSRGPTTDSPVSDAYAPAYNATFHSFSLRNVYRRDYVTDFSRIEGLAVRCGLGAWGMGGGGADAHSSVCTPWYTSLRANAPPSPPTTRLLLPSLPCRAGHVHCQLCGRGGAQAWRHRAVRSVPADQAVAERRRRLAAAHRPAQLPLWPVQHLPAVRARGRLHAAAARPHVVVCARG